MQRAIHCVTLAAVIGSLTAAAAAQGTLLVVDAAGGPGADATSIADAISLAQDGDTLLVRAGSYLPFTIEARTLVIVAAPGAAVVVEDTDAGPPNDVTTVRGVSPSQVVVLEGLILRGGAWGTTGLDALSIEQCAGQVWIQDCTLEPMQALDPPGFVALRVSESTNVLVVRSSVHGGVPPLPTNIGGGLSAQSSRVFTYESAFIAGVAGSGAHLIDSLLFAEETTLQGGPPIVSLQPHQCVQVIHPGPGLSLMGASKVELLDSTYVVGPNPYPGCGIDGWDLLGPASAVHVIDGPALSFTASSPTLDGEPTDLTLRGPPGDLGLALVATSLPDVVWLGKFKGAFITGSPLLLLLGPLPPSGELVLSLDLGDMLAPGTGSTVFLQGGVLHAAGGAQLGDPTVWTAYEE